MATDVDHVDEGPEKKGIGLGLAKGLSVTLRTMMKPAVTQAYPHVKPDLPPRTRGVIALKEANCTVCYKCSRECPDWCIYIDAHKETHDPAGGGRARSAKILDRFAIDYALCMYCGICVEVCPFDALFWSPEFEYAEYDIDEMTHEKERLEEWTYKVLPPPPLEAGAEPPEEVEIPVAEAAAGGATAAAGTTAAAPSQPQAPPPAPSPAPGPRAVEESAPPEPGEQTPEETTPNVAQAGEHAVQPTVQDEEGKRMEVSLDQETFDRVLQELIDKGTDRRVAEGQARRAAMIAARKADGGGVRGALSLVVSLASVGIVFLVAGAEFIGGVQILIYVGSIVILFLFGLMLTKAPIGKETQDNQQRALALVVALGVLAGLVFLIQDAYSLSAPKVRLAHSTSAAIGESMFSRFVLPFEAISFLLLAALIGAVVLARKDDGE
jgi:NADH-quinone oxidoreductase subunit I